jgi:hypothetical protein
MSVESQTISPETEFCRIINKRAQHSFLPRYFSDSLFRCQGQGRAGQRGLDQWYLDWFLPKDSYRNVPAKKVPAKKAPETLWVPTAPKRSSQKGSHQKGSWKYRSWAKRFMPKGSCQQDSWVNMVSVKKHSQVHIVPRSQYQF